MFLGALVIVIVGILVVNYFKEKKAEVLPAVSTEVSATTKEHTVTKGETLWSIAEDSFGSGYNWTDIKTANKLTTETIEVGQKLTIPEVAAKKPTATKQTVTAQPVQAEKTIANSTYTVQKGDTLWSISVRAYGDGYQWTNVAKVNKLVNPNLIHSGNILVLPR